MMIDMDNGNKEMREKGLVLFTEERPVDGEKCELWVIGFYGIQIKLGERDGEWVYYGGVDGDRSLGVFIQQVDFEEKKRLSGFYNTRYVGVQQNVLKVGRKRESGESGESDEDGEDWGINKGEVEQGVVDERALWWKRVEKE